MQIIQIIIIAAATIGLALLCYRYIFKWNNLDRLRRKAAEHHEWDQVLLYGREQLALRSTDDPVLHNDMAYALYKRGRIDEAFGHACQVQRVLTRQHNPDWSPADPDDFGRVSAFFTSSSKFLRAMEVLGWCYLERNQAGDAAPIFQYLAGMGGRKVNRNIPLAEALAQAGNGDEAAKALRKLFTTAPGKAMEIKSCLPRVLELLPCNAQLRAFEAEFMVFLGTAQDKLDELAAATGSGKISCGELLLFHALAQQTKRMHDFTDALQQGSEELLRGNDQMRRLLNTLAADSGIHDLRITAMNAMHEAGEDISAACLEIAGDEDMPPETRLSAIDLYYRTHPGAKSSEASDLDYIKFSIASGLAGSATTQQHSIRLLQDIASSSSHLAGPARIKLARLLIADDVEAAKQYLRAAGSLVEAAVHARESVLADAYDLGNGCRDPDMAFAVFRDICLVDLEYRDASTRRDRLRELIQSGNFINDTKETVVAVSAGNARHAREDPGITGLTGILSSFDTSRGNRRNAGNVRYAPGDVVDDRYRIISTIGVGGMGTVMRAMDERLQREVAVKFMTATGPAGEHASARFELEARAAASIFKHEGVVKVLDLSEGEPPYIVMELVDGRGLNDLIGTPELTVETTIAILDQVADVLGYAHDQGLLHRDIKPANIMIETNPLRAKVTDFGLAKRVNQSAGLTSTGTVVGTALYMSPEQIRGKPLDPRSDIYSLGVTAYEMCAGHPPFVQGEISYQQVHVPPPPLADEVGDDVPRQLTNLIMQCLAKKPDDRPASCAELRERLPE